MSRILNKRTKDKIEQLFGGVLTVPSKVSVCYIITKRVKQHISPGRDRKQSCWAVDTRGDRRHTQIHLRIHAQTCNTSVSASYSTVATDRSRIVTQITRKKTFPLEKLILWFKTSATAFCWYNCINIEVVLPLIDFTLLNTLRATSECPAGCTLAGPRAPAATLAQRVTNMPVFL